MKTETLTLKKAAKPTAIKSKTTGFRIKHEANEQTADISSAPIAVEREKMIADAAYYRAEQRGFQPGHEMMDWLEAEQEVNNSLDNTVTIQSA
jgi:hypothetical protein